jgi:hypothetical protein
MAGDGAAAAAGAAPSRFNRFRGSTGLPSVQPVEPGAGGTQLAASISGPSEVKVGDEFTVTLQLQSDQKVPRLRAQLRFDVTTFQFVSGEPGSLVGSADGAKVSAYAGGVQVDATAPADDPFDGTGDVMVLKFKALQARPQTAFAGMVTAMSGSGASIGSSSPEPLALAVTGN